MKRLATALLASLFVMGGKCEDATAPSQIALRSAYRTDVPQCRRSFDRLVRPGAYGIDPLGAEYAEQAKWFEDNCMARSERPEQRE